MSEASMTEAPAGWLARLLGRWQGAPGQAAQEQVVILFGSQSGNAEGLAYQLRKRLQAVFKGQDAAPRLRLLSMDQYGELDWSRPTTLLCLASSWGAGELPDPAQPFWRWLSAQADAALAGFRFAVLGLGNSTYPDFCGGGAKLDARLAALGAERLLPLVRCDLDYAEPAGRWLADIGGLLPSLPPLAAAIVPGRLSAPEPVPAGAPRLTAMVRENCCLTAPGAVREVRHLVLALPEGDDYQPGDYLAVYPDGDAVRPRYYSLASAPDVHPGEVHLTVAVLRAEAGLCSSFLADQAAVGRTLTVSLQPAPHFRLPDDPAADLILIGAGTGIAPFRSFVQARRARAQTGRTWLVCGHRQRQADFLYGDEWLASHAEGVLHRLDTAFSRDQEGKVYVQHQLLAQSPEVWEWLQLGAYVYVCGDATRMAGDVDAALLVIAEREGGLCPAAAQDWLVELGRSGRYRKDVY